MCDYLFGKIFRAPKNPSSDNWIQVWQHGGLLLGQGVIGPPCDVPEKKWGFRFKIIDES